jgi:hypothetical protein
MTATTWNGIEGWGEWAMLRLGSMVRRERRFLVGGAVVLVLAVLPPAVSIGDVDLALQYEAEVMDQCQTTFDVYTDQDTGGNHFQPSGWMGTASKIALDPEWMTNCHSGMTCIRITFTGASGEWAGIYWQEPANNWGTVANAGYDLSGATALTFWARGENGGEKVEFFVGGITGIHPDSLG